MQLVLACVHTRLANLQYCTHLGVLYVRTGPQDTDTHIILACTAYNNDTFAVDTSVYPS